jgi:peroxiredoxin
MKRTIALLACVLAIGSAMAQNNNSDEAKNVLRLSREKCQSIKQGHYVMEHKKKYMSEKDTTGIRFTCDFRKLPDDTIYGKAFNMTFELMDEEENWKGLILYTGREQVWINDTVAEIQSCDQWADEIIAGRHNQVFYTALTNKSCYPLPDEEHLADSSYSYSLSDVELDGRPCHLASYRKTDWEPDTIFGIQTLLYEVKIWIDKRDYLPMQYSVAFVNLEQQDTLYQYEECRLTAFDTVLNPRNLTLDAIPANLPKRDYVPYTPPEPLAEGTLAPDWSLPTLTGDTVRLADLRDKVVLLDFFYKKCAPCCAALPFLQNLHEKYKDKGVVLLGIDPYDDPAKDEMADFLAKRGITYTVLFSDYELSQTYHIAAYPTLFFIDRDGKIAKVHRGYHKMLEEAIEEQLQKMLE